MNAPKQRPIIVAFLGSLLWWGVFAGSVGVFGIPVIIACFIDRERGHRLALVWARLNIRAMTLLCGLDYRVEGQENLPEKKSKGLVIMSNHQSTWETLALSYELPMHVWVLKRELMWIPFFGWALGAVRAIAINRSAGESALDQVITQGRDRMQDGLSIMIFPEGTRVKPGVDRRYKQGGSVLATETGRPVLPVAHNAGHFWPRASFIKRAGMITIRIGPLIQSEGKTAPELNAQVREWITTQQLELDADAKSQLSAD